MNYMGIKDCGKQKNIVTNKYKDELEIYKSQQQQLVTRNIELEKSIVDYHNKYIKLKEKYDLLVSKRYCNSPKIIFMNEQQQLSIDGNKELAVSKEETPFEPGLYPKRYTLKMKTNPHTKRRGRKPISAFLERRIKVIDIDETKKKCRCGAKLVKTGRLTSEKLQIIPQEIYVELLKRLQYTCRHCKEEKPRIRVSPVEPSIIPRGIASASVLSTIITQKFEMHLPYYRQEKQFMSIGVAISRQDMCNWQQYVYKNITPLFIRLKEMVKCWSVLQMDETTFQVIGEENRNDKQKSYMWVANGGAPGKKVVWYEYHSSRAGSHAKEFLDGFVGYLQTDGFSGYDSAVKGNENIIQVGCFAHARRKFLDASKMGRDTKTAQVGLSFIRKLYEIEKKLRRQWEKDNKTEKFLFDRKSKCTPELAKFRFWLEKMKNEVPGITLLGMAIKYNLSQWEKLVAYLENPYLTPDNNACESAIRPFVIGRKNWLFSQSPEGAKSSAGMFTLIETAKANGLVPFQYLKALFEKAPYASSFEDWEQLLPWYIFQN